MAMSKRSREKGAWKAAKLLPPGTVIREYVRGRAHVRMTTGATVAILLIVLVFFAALAAGQVIIPGALLVIWLSSEIRPYRAVIVTSLGIVLLTYSIITGRSKVIAYLPLEAAVQPVQPHGKAKLPLGPDLVTLTRRDHQLLVAAATTAHAQLVQTTAQPVAPAYHPAPGYNPTPGYNPAAGYNTAPNFFG
jgi:hypothetical protein